MKSKFDGGLLGLIGISILAGALITFTIGLALPWVICFYISWLFKHITIDGKRLTFDGNGGQLFGSYLKWMILTVITCGIYGLWVPLKVIGWTVSHVHVADAPAA